MAFEHVSLTLHSTSVHVPRDPWLTRNLVEWSSSVRITRAEGAMLSGIGLKEREANHWGNHLVEGEQLSAQRQVRAQLRQRRRESAHAQRLQHGVVRGRRHAARAEARRQLAEPVERALVAPCVPSTRGSSQCVGKE
jgi:hypothetical protein